MIGEEKKKKRFPTSRGVGTKNNTDLKLQEGGEEGR